MKYFIPVSDEIPYDHPLFTGEMLVPYRVEFPCCRGVSRLPNESAVDKDRKPEVSDDE